MGKGMWLVMCFKGEKFDVRIDDVDEINILDLLIDIDEQAKKQIVCVPKNPVLTYYDGRRDMLVEVDGDDALTAMLDANAKEEEVAVFIEDSDEPSEVVKVAWDLRDRRNNDGGKGAQSQAYDGEEVALSDDEEVDATFVPPEPKRKRDTAFDPMKPISVQIPVQDIESGKVIYEEPPPPGPPRRKWRNLRSNTRRLAELFEHDSDADEDEHVVEGGLLDEAAKEPAKECPASVEVNENTVPQTCPRTPSGKRIKRVARKSPLVRESPPSVESDEDIASRTTQGVEEEVQATFEQLSEEQREMFYTDMAHQHGNEENNEDNGHELPQSQHFDTPSSPPPCTQSQQVNESHNEAAQDELHEFVPPQPTMLRQRKLSHSTVRRIKKGLKTMPAESSTGDGTPSSSRANTVRGTGTEHPPPPTKRSSRFSGQYEFTNDDCSSGSGSDTDFCLGSEEGEDEDTDTSLEEEQLHEATNPWAVNDEDDYKFYQNSSDDEDYTDRIYTNGQFYRYKPFGSIRLEEFDIFVDREDFHNVLADYCVQERFDIVRMKSDLVRFTAECATQGCPWRIHSSLSPDEFTWQIKTMRKEHTCAKLLENKMANCAWLVRHLMTDVKANPNIPGASIVNLCMERYGLRVKPSLAFKVRDQCKAAIEGTYDESYAVLPAYPDVIRQTNPGSFTNIPWAPDPPYLFTKCFIAPEALVHGFKFGCRTPIGVDGCHLKGYYGGVLLSAVSLDANQEMFPFAYAVVGEENKETWTFFFNCLRVVIGEGGNRPWTFISDRQKGIDPALDIVFPRSPRRICTRHLMKNFKKHFPAKPLL